MRGRRPVTKSSRTNHFLLIFSSEPFFSIFLSVQSYTNLPRMKYLIFVKNNFNRKKFSSKLGREMRRIRLGREIVDVGLPPLVRCRINNLDKLLIYASS